MITQDSILLATPIALSTEKDMHEEVGPVIKGLNLSVGNLSSYTAESVAIDVPDYTSLVTDHTLYQDEATTAIAGAIRQAYGVIGKFVKPICTRLDDCLTSTGLSINSMDSILRCVNIKMINIEPAFFSSPYYPNEIPANLLTSDITPEEFIRGAWPEMTGEEIYDLIYVDLPELGDTYFSDKKTLADIYNDVFIYKNFYRLFNYANEKFEMGEVEVGNGIKINNFHSLVIVYLFLTKLGNMETPLKGVTGLTLEDYNGTIAVSRDYLKKVLVQFRDYWITRARSGMIIDHTDTKWATNKELKNREESRWDTAIWGDNTKYLSGSITIGYTNELLHMFGVNDEISLSEFAIGMTLCHHQGIRVTDLVTNKREITGALNEYMSTAYLSALNHFVNFGTEKTRSIISEFYANEEEFRLLCNVAKTDKTDAYNVLNELNKSFDINSFFTYFDKELLISGKVSMMETPLSEGLCKLLGSSIGADIMSRMRKVQGDSVGDYRKKMTKAAAAMIVDRLFNK